MDDKILTPSRRSNPETVSAQSYRAQETSEMRRWAETLKLNKPIPRDVLPLLAKDGAKQLEIVMKHMHIGKQEQHE
ncbi:hypothetical protein HBI56_049860 [Parastagonospora nodorum]|uniref:Uncharacterized protein n=2 Tax=Phaeosphaeria nodorum (strain SN15 / ATCC MYA-4574 / FGSC 10173) TaxID=321614 RepID=A0A7U2EU90_PHANO|nr:hypothetical protein SNOG_02253 [Parastagonospora nodorum SN15]KAH3916762.1 hypothetical protein HBH56_062790 [Parastagonospora nodorum]EAT90465.1 hypothetical protein SNOG_02253 [Parastagonospora nodorum SN15]KAH3930649.1 hypothetical protein HBH54_106730 [Parastagonospora nodorum]KAH3954434.1 hypothetical protein HBH53_021670 [Parastagonospora nodorum]KAH3968237.1 hypothetical protein HBH51_132000 [Parastagonospora nodorum]